MFIFYGYGGVHQRRFTSFKGHAGGKFGGTVSGMGKKTRVIEEGGESKESGDDEKEINMVWS